MRKIIGSVILVFALLTFLTSGCNRTSAPSAAQAISPQPGSSFTGNLEGEKEAGSGTISFDISEDGTAINNLNITLNDSSANCGGASTGTLGFGQLSLPFDGPYLIKEGNFSLVISKSGELKGKFVSPTEASGSINLILEITLFGNAQTCDFGTWNWSAKLKQ